MNSASPASGRSSNRWLILANVTLGTFMSTLDGSIANVALPTISAELKTPLHVVQWVLTAYLLTICAILPVMGKLSDLLGRSRVYNIGFLVFAAGSACCGLSHALGPLIVSRVIQALGAACLMSNSQAIIAEVFATGGRGRAMGITGTMVSLGSLTGPGLGGILVERLGWPSIFWINVPIGIVAFAAGLFLLPRSGKKAIRETFDYTGSILFIAGIVAFLYTVSNAQDWGWSSLRTGLLGAFSAAALAAFFLWERRVRHPMLDLSLYRNRTFAIGNLTAFLSFIAMFFTNVMMPFYMQNVLGYSAELTGYTMMVFPLTMAVVAPVSGWLSDKIGPNLLTTLGLAVNALGFALLQTLTTDERPWVVGLHLSLFGLGGGLFQSPNNSSVMGAVDKPRLGTAGGLNALVRNVGMVLGTAFSVSLYTTRLSSLGMHAGAGGKAAPGPMLTSLHAVFWTAMGVCLLALAVSVRRIRRRRPQEAAA